MSGITIGWNNAAPAAGDNAGSADDEMRSLKTNLQGGLNAEHLFPSGGGYAGVHRAGSARIFSGTSSAVSSADTDGRLMIDSTKSRLYYVGSDVSTYKIGDQSTPEVRGANGAGTTVTLSHTSGWVMSVFTIEAKTSPTTPGLWTFPADMATAFFVTIDSDVSQNIVPAFATVQVFGGGSTKPDIYLWNPDGSTYSGATLICNVVGLHVDTL